MRRRVARPAQFEERAPGQLARYLARSQSGEALQAKDAEVEAILGVRRYCADHPATGSTRELERAAAECLAAKAAVAEVDNEAAAMLLDLVVGASRHYERAVRAYAKAARRSAPGRG